MRSAFLTFFALLWTQIASAQGHGLCVDQTVRRYLAKFEPGSSIQLANLTPKTVRTSWTFPKTNNAIVAVNRVDVPTLQVETPTRNQMSLNYEDSAVVLYLENRSSKTEYHIVFNKCVPNRLVALETRKGNTQRSVFVVNVPYCLDFTEKVKEDPTYLAGTHWRELIERSCKGLS